MKQFIKQKLRGRTQRWLSEQTGIREADLSNSMRGIHRQFRIFEWDKIVAALGLTAEDLESEEVKNYPFSLKSTIH